MNRFRIALFCVVVTCNADAHEYITIDELTAAMDFAGTEIRTEDVGAGLHVLFGAGGNVLVSIGDQGTLTVDSQYAQMVPYLKEAIGRIGGDRVDFTINTHWHYDHVGGNPVLGREGTWFVSQSNSRRMMAGEHLIDVVNLPVRVQAPYTGPAMPVISFSDHMLFHFNGHTIDLFHFGPAHTTGDAAVFFREANVLHMGDVFNASYPFIDAGNGGDVEGMLRFCEKILARMNVDSIIVPGHGPVMGYDDMAAYIHMLETVSTRISNMIDAGMSLEEVVAQGPTAEFDERYGDPARFVNRAYMSLSR